MVHHHLDTVLGPHGDQRLWYDRVARYKPESILLTGDESYDKERYAELLLRAADTLLAPFGYPAERIQSWLDTQ